MKIAFKVIRSQELNNCDDTMQYFKKKNLHYTRGITPMRVTNGEVHLCGLALDIGQHNSEKTSQRWRAGLADPGIESKTSRDDSVFLTITVGQ